MSKLNLIAAQFRNKINRDLVGNFHSQEVKHFGEEEKQYGSSKNNKNSSCKTNHHNAVFILDKVAFQLRYIRMY